MTTTYDKWSGVANPGNTSWEQASKQYAKEAEDRLMKMIRGEGVAALTNTWSDNLPPYTPSQPNRGIKITTHDDLAKVGDALAAKITYLDTYMRNEVASNIRLSNRVAELEEQVKDLRFLLTEMMEDL